MTKSELKVIGLKVNTGKHKIISLRAMKENKDIAQMYRDIIDWYFEQNPLSIGEKEIISK